MHSNFNISLITDTSLDNFRLIGDPLADEVISKIITSGFEKQINDVIMTLVRNESFAPGAFSSFGPQLSAILDEYFELSGRLPDWADPSLIKGGEEVFSLYGSEIFMLLNVSSLPLCYTCAKGAQVLYDTGRLLVHNQEVDPLARRLMETAQMIFNVMTSGGLTTGGEGVVTIQKIRLIHASIRCYLKQGQYNHTPWEVEKYGEPINQEDLAGTLMSFGPVILNGLKQLNVALTEQQVAAYMHCWKVVGHLMGIQEPLLPNTYEEGFELAIRILKHQADESEAGKALTRSCIEFINSIVPGNAFNDVPAFFMDFFLQEFSKSSGKDLSKCIGLVNQPDTKDKLVLSLAKYLVGKVSHLEHLHLVRKITAPFNRLLLQGIIHHFNGGKKVHFLIPPSLQKDWGLTDEWSDHKILIPSIMGNRLAWQKKSETID